MTDVVQYVAYLRAKKLHTVGDTRYDVSDIAIKGERRDAVQLCENKSLDRYADGTPAEQPMPFFAVKGDARQERRRLAGRRGPGRPGSPPASERDLRP